MNSLITVLAPLLGDLVKRLIPDADKTADVEREIKLALLENADSLEALSGKIVLAEASSTNWLTAAWRPLLMMVIIAIVAVSYLVFPIINLFTVQQFQIELPIELWNLLQIGVGGYVVGRSGEKMVNSWRNGDSS